MNEVKNMLDRDTVIRAIEAYLTSDKRDHRKPKAEQILFVIERLGYKSPEIVWDMVMGAKKSGWDDCMKFHNIKS